MVAEERPLIKGGKMNIKKYDKALSSDEVVEKYNEANFEGVDDYIDIPAKPWDGIKLSEKSSNDYRQVSGHYRGVTYAVVHNPLLDHIHYTIQRGDITICYTTKGNKPPSNEEMEARLDEGYV